MKRVTAAGTLSLAALTVFAGPLAQADSLTAWYLGGGGGQARSSIDDVRITNGLLAGGFTSVSITDYDRPTGYKLFGGYQINKYIAVEGGYFDLGQSGFVATTVPVGTLSGTIKVKGLNLDLVGTLPITDKFSAFARVGVNRAEAEDTFTGTGRVRALNSNPSKTDTNYKYGVGLRYAMTDALGVRVEAERYRIDDAVGNKGDIDLVSVGLDYRFGRKVQAPLPSVTRPEPVAAAAPTVAPAPVAAAPAPQPAAAAMPPPPPPRKVTFSADALFDFDKATLKPAGKQALDKFATDLRGTTFDVITVTGHTDRIGSREYNQKLSTRRADAVKNYLVDPSGIPVAKIVSRGADKSSPVTKPGDCKGGNATKALIACLQPDRRVEVEVTATKR